MPSRFARCLTATVLVAVTTVSAAAQDADLVLLNGRVATIDTHQGYVEAVATKGDMIAAVGTTAYIRDFIGPDTQVIDLEGRFTMPGFIEGHAHFTGLGQSKMNLDLMPVTSWQEVIQMVAAAVDEAEPGEWIIGRGWHQEKWDQPPATNVEGFPTHDDLSAVSPDNPVFLTHASGHASFANAKAMELADVTQSTPDPDGGEILRDVQGKPIGIFRETASGLIRRVSGGGSTMRRNRLAQTERAIELATEECLKHGVTSFQDAGSSFFEVDLFRDLAERNELGVRLWVMIREPNERLRAELPDAKHHRINDRFTVGGLKRSIDGALGARGAWLLEPYADSPESTGLETVSVAEVTETANIALEHGLQMCVHAIGDRANREVLDIYEGIFKAHPDQDDLRWRIEHAQHLHPVDIHRFGTLGVIASMQGIHCTSDGPWVMARLGPQRARSGAYVWQQLFETGATIINGTDAPVEPIDPIASFYASVTRKMKDGRLFYPGERMTRHQALRSYTIKAAYAAFEDDIKGSLTPGKLADIVVLSRDIMKVPDDQILGTRVVLTIVGGKVVYDAR